LIRRKKKTSNFTVLPNIVLTDERISIAARWCLAYLLSKPDDWVVQISDIQKVAGVGRDKAYSMVRELIDSGWIKREEYRDETGAYRKHEYVVSEWSENPINDPLPEKPDPVKPDTANTHLTKNGNIPRTESTKNSVYDEDFKGFWKAYPKREGGNSKANAFKSWKRALRKASVEEIMRGVEGYRKHCDLEKKTGTQWVKQAEFWLNGELWESFTTGGANGLTDEERQRKLAALYA
jgi:hypothetical protein